MWLEERKTFRNSGQEDISCEQLDFTIASQLIQQKVSYNDMETIKSKKLEQRKKTAINSSGAPFSVKDRQHQKLTKEFLSGHYLLRRKFNWKKKTVMFIKKRPRRRRKGLRGRRESSPRARPVRGCVRIFCFLPFFSRWHSKSIFF